MFNDLNRMAKEAKEYRKKKLDSAMSKLEDHNFGVVTLDSGEVHALLVMIYKSRDVAMEAACLQEMYELGQVYYDGY